MNKRQILIGTFLLIVLGTSGIIWFQHAPRDSSIQSIDSLDQVVHELENCDSKTLILFDIDDVLINPVDVLARSGRPSLWFRLQALWKYPQLLQRTCREHFYSIMWQQTQWYVIEPDVVEIINACKNHGCIVLALSSMETGQFGVINNFPEWRYEILKNLGLEFSADFENVIFKNLPPYRQNYPELYKGILCCNQQSKGAVLAAFLDHFALAPSAIIFFDDSLTNLHSVSSVCKKRNIQFKGFEYVRGKDQSMEWDNQQAWLQLDRLIVDGQWLSDKEAYRILKSNSLGFKGNI